MPRNGTKVTPKDLLTELARRKDGVTRVRAYISGIAEPVTAFRVSADGSLKMRMEEWKAPNCYTSGLRNLLQRHFKKVTAGEWFASGAVLVQTQVADSVERTWGRGTRQLHPKWDNVTWEEVHVPSDKEVRSLSLVSRSLSLQPSEEEASNTHANLPEANAQHGEALAPTDQSTLPQSQSAPAPAQNQLAMHQNMPFSQLPPAYPNESTPTIIQRNQLPAQSSHGVAKAPPALAPALATMSRVTSSQGVLRDSSQANTRFDFHKGGGLGMGKAASAAGGMYSESKAAVPAPSVTYSQDPATYSPMVCSGLPQSHPASVVDVERPGAGLSRDPRNLLAMTSEQPVTPKQFSPFVLSTNSGQLSPIALAGAAHGSLAGAVHRPVGNFVHLASGFEMSAGASGQSGSETLSGRKRCHSTMASPHAEDVAAADTDCEEKADLWVASFEQASTQSMFDHLTQRKRREGEPQSSALKNLD